MRRVLVIGSPGAGKSTLATELARRTELPLIHLDQEHWQPGWIEMDKATWKARMRDLVTADRWIIDGNYGASLDIRIKRADTIILLDFPVWLCLARVVRRVRETRGRVRPDMAEGCPERFNLPFLLYVARYPLGARRRNARKLEGFRGKLVRLRSPREAELFLNRFAAPFKA